MTPPHLPDARRLGPQHACLIACLVCGCGEASYPTAPGKAASAEATAAPSPAQDVSAPAKPTIVAAKSDRDSVLASLKEQGIQVLLPQDMDVRSYRYTGPKASLVWFVEIERKPAVQGQDNPLSITLPPDGGGVDDEKLDLILLPPKSTGREGLLVVLRSVSGGGGQPDGGPRGAGALVRGTESWRRDAVAGRRHPEAQDRQGL